MKSKLRGYIEADYLFTFEMRSSMFRAIPDMITLSFRQFKHGHGDQQKTPIKRSGLIEVKGASKQEMRTKRAWAEEVKKCIFIVVVTIIIDIIFLAIPKK